LDQDPLQSPSPPPGRPTRRSEPTSLRFRCPTTTSPESAPYEARVRPPRPGPARRFSQPLGGFLANPSLRPCFMPLPPLGHLSLQSLTSLESLHPFRGRSAPLRSFTHVRRAPLAALSPRVSPTPSPSLGHLPVSPRDYGQPFGRPAMDGSPPVRPGPRATGSRPAARFIRFEACSLQRSPRCRPRRFPCRSSRALLGFRPSRAFSTRSSDPI